MGIHQRPVPPKDNSFGEDEIAHLHFHFDPPLLRSATVRKFLVGFVFPIDFATQRLTHALLS